MAIRRTQVASYRSGLEQMNAELMRSHGVPFEYESFRIPFLQPEKNRQYTPDFLLLTNGIIIETKGELVTADRQKHILVKEQHPQLDIRFVFSNARAKIYKGSKTTHAAWADQHGFRWANKLIPQTWIDEPINHKSSNYLRQLRSSTK